jgi:hypothetical protein
MGTKVRQRILTTTVSQTWQPGAEDAEVIEFIESCPNEIKDKVIYGGPCILVEGKTLAKEKGKL